MIRNRPPTLRRPLTAVRQAFTLVELLVVLVVMLLLVAMTASAVNVSYSRDRVRGAARQIQSYLLGARDLAIYAREARGVRFLADPTNPRQISSMVLVQPTPPWAGQVSIVRRDETSPWDPSAATPNALTRVRLKDTSQSPNWIELRDLGLLMQGTRIRIPGNSRGSWYIVNSLDVDGANQDLLLTTAYRDPPPQVSPAVINEQALIELPPSIVPNKQPVPFSKGAVIDLDRCGMISNWATLNDSNINDVFKYGLKLPSPWKIQNSAATFRYSSTMDVMFSPQGTVTGVAASTGIIHLVVTEQAAADQGLPTFYDPTNFLTWSGNPTASTPQPYESVPDKSVVSIFTRTGGAICSPVETTYLVTTASPVNQRVIASDPFVYAERGEVAGR